MKEVLGLKYDNLEVEDSYHSLSKQRKNASDQFKEMSNKMIMGVDLGNKTDTSCIIFTSTPNNKKGFFYDCFNNMSLEANQFASLPKFTWDFGWNIRESFNKKPVINIKCQS
mgnify:FL=1